MKRRNFEKSQEKSSEISSEKSKLANCEAECARKFGSDGYFEDLSLPFLDRFGRFLRPDILESGQKTEKQHPRTCEPILKKISTDFAPPGVNEKQVWHSCPLVSGRE